MNVAITSPTRLTIATVEHGEGPPIFFLPGGGVSVSYYDSFIKLLSKRHRVISVNYPGFGGSDQFQQDVLSLNDLSEVMHSVISSFDTTHVFIVAHSMSGAVALNCQAKYPSLINKAVLIAPMLQQLEQSEAEIARLVTQNYFINKKQSYSKMRSSSKQLLEMLKEHNAMRQQMSMLRTNAKVEFPSSCSTKNLVILGEKDVIFPLDTQRQLIQKLENAHTVTIPGAGHDPEFTHMPEVISHITEFFSDAV